MSSEPHLPGYSIDDDDDTSNDPPTAEPEHEGNLVPVTTAGGDDDVPSAAATTAATQSLPAWTQPTRTLSSQWSERAADTTPTAPERPAVDEFADPKIAQLHAIFPDYDAGILHSVVDSVGGDQDRAVDALLAMSDPDHISVAHVIANEQPSVVEQTQLDEELARRLQLEDEQQYAREQIAQQQQQQQMHQYPYAPRTNAPVPPQQQGGRGYAARGDVAAQQQPPPQRDTLADVQEQLSKMAESGKRTFSTFMSKVKAKVQEMDQPRSTPNPSSSPDTNTGTGYVVQPQSPVLDRPAQRANYAPTAVHGPRPVTVEDEFESGHTDPVFRDLGERADSHALRPLLPPSSSDNDYAPHPAFRRYRALVTLADLQFSGKIGLLPKRPVSLVNAESQPRRAHDEDEEELEYVENPFEEGRYS
ncbi:hypothetical protein F5148DRAFT_1285174 [Russula earlei]|uniref:Uncharacterized protein n=1 Tax=Russula earlei TaxID=71964 RepID=A0ACC0U6X8_9AGAM|nr:hypothetical protein F5148DRAFT_1285174 [Russula earlei]